MAEKVLRWGLLSTANINKALIEPLRMSERNELVGVASRSLERAKSYAREREIPRAYGSYEEMLADPAVDVIYNSLPNALHAEWTIKAAQAGKHVLCEKPLAISLEEVDAIRRAADEAGVVVAEAFMYRHHRQTLEVKKLVDDGDIGQLQLIRGVFTFSLSNFENVRMKPDLGGGSLWDIGCYPVSYARYLAGMEPVEAFGWQVNSRTGVDDAFVGQLRFPENIYAQFDSGFRTPFRSFIEVVGSEGSIHVPAPYKPGKSENIRLIRGGKVLAMEIYGEELYLGEVEDMADAILEGKKPRISLEDSRGNVEAILALLQSARESRPVAVGR